MKVVLDQNTLQTISLLQKLTGVSIIDAMNNDEIYVVVAEGQYGLAVGKGGVKIKKAEHVFKKTIRIFEYSPSAEQFVRRMIPETQEFSMQDNAAVVKVRPADRAKVIGKGGKNIRIVNQFVQRLFEIDEVKVK